MGEENDDLEEPLAEMSTLNNNESLNSSKKGKFNR